MTRCKLLLSLCMFLLATLTGSPLMAPPVYGQAVTATLVGSVVDTSGRQIAGAHVTITGQQTGVVHTQTTNQSGNYDFTLLPPGIYSVSVAAQGFASKLTRDVSVPVNTTARVNVTLSPGSVSQTVTVTDQAPLLQTDRADVNAQIDSVQVEDLPNGSTRNFQTLESLVPGVSLPVYDQSSFFNAQNSQAFQVNGQGPMSNNLQIEGIDDNEFSGALQVYIPPAAAIQTVDVETSNYAPEFGRSTGAVTNVILKSGTNAFHGSAYEYNQVSATSARSYFNRTGAFPRYTYNYTGGTLGGPLRKNHSFFFADYLRTTNYSSSYELLTLPTAAFRSGDLSASPSNIYDPQTGNANGSGRQQFVTNGVPNVIPANRISSIAKSILAMVPLPNIPGAGDTDNFQQNLGYQQVSDQVDGKIDQNLGPEDHLDYRYSWQQVSTVQQPSFGLAGGPENFQGAGAENIYNTAGEYTHVFSPTFLTELRAGVDHDSNYTYPTDYGTDASAQLGIPGVNVSPFTSGLTTISVADYSSPLVGYSPYEPWVRSETNIDLVNNWTKILGNHSLKFGFEMRGNRQDLIQIATYSPRGVFDYGTGQTALNASGAKTSYGNAFASFLLDVPSTVGREVNVGDASWREQLYFGFAQDTWQVSPKLTLTYGMRIGVLPAAYPKQAGGFSQYDPSTNSLDIAGDGNIPLNLGVGVHEDPEPRFGFAYRAAPTMVVRGGFGMSHTPWQGLAYAYNYPVRTNISFNPVNSYSPALNESGVPETLSEGFPPATTVPIPADGILPDAAVSSAWTVVNTHYKDPYVMSYNLSVQQNLGRQWVATISYIGNLGRQIPASYNLNAGLIPGAGAKGQPEYATYGRTASTNLVGYATSSNYNALQMRLDHRYSHGVEWASSFAWQKSMGWVSNSVSDGGIGFYIDLPRNYSPSSYTSALTYAQSVVYDLPFGDHGDFLRSGWMSKAAGGWKIAGIVHVQSGTPLTFTADASQLDAPGSSQLANEVKPFRKLYGIGTSQPWFDTSAFTQPVGAVLGDTGENIYSGPGLFTFDASAFRTIHIHDALALELRMDAFNAFNHPVFSNPNTSLTSASFGDVTGTVGTGVNGTAGTPRALQFAGTFRF
ncbi:MAG TPA: carboxypeptidase-like regulatory domain-containing protein [Terracidiphilus sp.]|nr:carboxypeptidase-like regulatory domain-containing protein [Terracidiphilus sp.]